MKKKKWGGGNRGRWREEDACYGRYAWEIFPCPVESICSQGWSRGGGRDMWQIRNAELDIVDQGGCVEFRSNR